jgi:3-hydroxyisobutyrate dehydrogenase-like beta-hydroxyacid dehydrogenase
MSERVGVVGVGTMGKLMAARLLRAGHEVTVCAHRDRRPVEELVSLGAREAGGPAGVAAASEVVVTMVPDAPEVEEACFGERGIAAGRETSRGVDAGRELTVIDMSTISPVAARTIAARLAERGIGLLDAPVSGGPARAATGDLTVMVGGDAALLERHRAVLEALGSTITHVGPAGHGQIAKLTNATIIGVLMPALGEALAFAAKAGADPAKVREVVLASTGANYLLERWLPQNVMRDAYEPGFALRLMHKDLGAVLSAAGDLGVPMPETGLAH